MKNFALEYFSAKCVYNGATTCSFWLELQIHGKELGKKHLPHMEDIEWSKSQEQLIHCLELWI